MAKKGYNWDKALKRHRKSMKIANKAVKRSNKWEAKRRNSR